MTIVESISARTAQTALIGVPPLPQCEVSVIVPVKDEAQTLVATLTALANQTDLNGQRLNPLTYEIIVLANNCIDESAAIARQFAKQHPDLVLHVAEVTLPPDRAYVGYVRKMLMDEAYLRLMSLGRSRGIIASTDGDTKVSATWVAAISHEIGSGVDAVGGRILTVGGASLFAKRLPQQKENLFTHIFSLVVPVGWTLPTNHLSISNINI
jgi:glycosyltransferase involved in cell wall biosynthesis